MGGGRVLFLSDTGGGGAIEVVLGGHVGGEGDDLLHGKVVTVLDGAVAEPFPEGRRGEDGQVEDDGRGGEGHEQRPVQHARDKLPFVHQVLLSVGLGRLFLLARQDSVDGLQGEHGAPLERVCGNVDGE